MSADMVWFLWEQALAQASAAPLLIRVVGGELFSPLSRDMDLIWSRRVERVRPIVGQVAVFMANGWRF